LIIWSFILAFHVEKGLILGSKIKHFKDLEERSGIEHKDMLFFDDEARNAEVETLGVTFVLIGSDGVTQSVFDEGVKEWRRRRKAIKGKQ
jgi:magnesium-dependent phosphatase 1